MAGLIASSVTISLDEEALSDLWHLWESVNEHVITVLDDGPTDWPVIAEQIDFEANDVAVASDLLERLEAYKGREGGGELAIVSTDHEHFNALIRVLRYGADAIGRDSTMVQYLQVVRDLTA